MTPDELAALNEQIAGMARAGLPLDQGLSALASDMSRGRLRTVTAAIADDVRAGLTLPEAIDRHRGVLPPYYAGLVLAGIRTGRVAEVLGTMSQYARTVAATRAMIVEALFYPAVVLVFGFSLFALTSFLILPQFKVMFGEFGLKLPLLTRAVLFVGEHPTAFVAAPVVALFVALAVRQAMRASANGRRAWARFVYSVPVFGTLLRSARLAAFADLLAVLVEFEVPLPEAFRLAGAASADPIMAGRSAEIHDRLESGVNLGDALRGGGLVPTWVAWMADAGARRGGLAGTLRQVAGVYQRQVEARAAVLRNVLPPLLIVGGGGLLVGTFVFALMLPVVRLLEGLAW
jgi:type II secretory pathway component PulF